MQTWRRVCLALLPVALALFGACDRLTAPPLPVGAEPFTPPAVYQEWWDLTEQCSGVSGNLAGVSWYCLSVDVVAPSCASMRALLKRGLRVHPIRPPCW